MIETLPDGTKKKRRVKHAKSVSVNHTDYIEEEDAASGRALSIKNKGGVAADGEAGDAEGGSDGSGLKVTMLTNNHFWNQEDALKQNLESKFITCYICYVTV